MMSLETDPDNPQNPLRDPASQLTFKALETQARSLGYTSKVVNMVQTLPDAGKELWKHCDTGSMPYKFHRRRLGLSRWNVATLACSSRAPAAPFIKASKLLVRRFRDLSGPVL